jgi:hypothetical protein
VQLQYVCRATLPWLILFSLGVKTFAVLLLLFASSSVMLSGGLPIKNRGTQLFVLIGSRHSGTHIVAMTPANRSVFQTWNRYNATYDFVSAIVHRSATGCTVGFTRYVMAEDYIPRIERLDLPFPYTQQPSYQFFDIGSIVGFYRNSAEDIDPCAFVKDSSHLTNR